jgi:hypothetical protein
MLFDPLKEANSSLYPWQVNEVYLKQSFADP